jgi:hypothetical protein
MPSGAYSPPLAKTEPIAVRGQLDHPSAGKTCLGVICHVEILRAVKGQGGWAGESVTGIGEDRADAVGSEFRDRAVAG